MLAVQLHDRDLAVTGNVNRVLLHAVTGVGGPPRTTAAPG
jgi:hypothetical protein